MFYTLQLPKSQQSLPTPFFLSRAGNILSQNPENSCFAPHNTAPERFSEQLLVTLRKIDARSTITLVKSMMYHLVPLYFFLLSLAINVKSYKLLVKIKYKNKHQLHYFSKSHLTPYIITLTKTNQLYMTPQGLKMIQFST